MKYTKFVALALVAAFFSCNDPASSSNQDKNKYPNPPSDTIPNDSIPNDSIPSNDTIPNNNGDDEYQSPVNGTISGSVIGTVTSGEIWLVEGINAGVSGGALMISAGFSSTSSENQIAISSPAGITDAAFVSSLGFSQTPANGTYTQASTSTCGGVTITCSSPSTIYTFLATSENDCDGSASGSSQGSYSLKISSVTLVNTASNGVSAVKYYKVHGSLDATLPGSAVTTSPYAITEGSVTIHLTF
jgi:hypothetical protein